MLHRRGAEDLRPPTFIGCQVALEILGDGVDYGEYSECNKKCRPGKGRILE